MKHATIPNAHSGKTAIVDETELTSTVVCGQRSYTVPRDVAGELSALQADLRDEEQRWQAAKALIATLRSERDELLEACKQHLEEWHGNMRNFERREPSSIKQARAALARCEKGGA